MNREIWEGGCICSQVRFQVTGELANIIYYHCRQCRRMSGHYFAATAVPDANLAFTCSKGLPWYASSLVSRRGFCRNCGSSLFFDHGPDEPIGVATGSFDDNPRFHVTAHIYTEEAGSYYEMPWDAPEYDGPTWLKGGWKKYRHAAKR